MKIKLDKQELSKILSSTTSIISGKSRLPILDTILIETDNEKIVFNSTDLEKSVRSEMKGEIQSTGKVCVNGKLLKGIIDSIPISDTMIVLSASEKELNIQTKSFESKLNIENPDDFPEFNQIDKKAFINVSLEKFINEVENVLFSASTDISRPVLSTVYLDFEENDVLYLISTDSYRLSKSTVEILSKGGDLKNILIPVKTIKDLKSVFSKQNEDEKLEIKISENQIEFATSQTSLTSRLTDGEYPDYKQVIPKDFNTKIVVPKSELLASCKLSNYFYENISITKVNVDTKKNTILILSEGKRGQGKYEIIPSEISGESVEISLNTKYLLEALRSINKDNIEIQFNGKYPPCKLTETEQKFYIIMPLKD